MSDYDAIGKAVGLGAQPKKKRQKPGKTGASAGRLAGSYGPPKTAAIKAGDLAASTGVANAPANPYDLNAPSTPESVQKQVEALANLQYGGTLSALRTQKTQVPQYFTDYRNRLQQLQQGQQGVYNQAVGQLGDLGTRLAQGAASVAQAAGARPSVSGAMPDQGVMDDAAKAAAVRAGMVGNFGGLLTSQGAAENSYLSNRDASSGPLEIQAALAVQQAIAQARADKGNYKTQALTDLKSQAIAQQEADSKSALDRAALALAGIKQADTVKTTVRGQDLAAKTAAKTRQADAAETAANNAADLTEAQIKAAADAKKQRQTARQKRREARQETREKHQEKTGEVKDIISQIRADGGDTTLVPILGADGKPTGETRAPTEQEVNKELRKKYTQRQIDKARARMQKNSPTKTVSVGGLKVKVKAPKS